MLILMLVILMLILMLLNLNTGYADTDADVCIRIMSLCYITVFFCGCTFLRFVSQIGICNFFDFIFLRFHTMAVRFLFCGKKLSILNTPLFMGMCIYLEFKLFFRSIEHIIQPKQKHLYLVLVNKSKLVQD